MSEFSDYAENAIINHLFRNTTLTSPTTVYLALFTAFTEGGTQTEVTGGGYARTAIEFDAPSGGVTQNTNLESFTASGANFGTVTHIAIMDASSGGNVLCWTPLDTSRVVNDGDTLEFAASSISITLQ